MDFFSDFHSFQNVSQLIGPDRLPGNTLLHICCENRVKIKAMRIRVDGETDWKKIHILSERLAYFDIIGDKMSDPIKP